MSYFQPQANFRNTSAEVLHDMDMKDAVLGKLAAEYAADLSDNELTRCLGFMGNGWLAKVKQWRDNGFIKQFEFDHFRAIRTARDEGREIPALPNQGGLF